MPHDENALRILMVLESDFAQRGGGGAESQVRTQCLHMRRLGHRVTVLTPMFPQGRQVRAERLHGIPIGRLDYPHWRLVGGAVMCLRFASFLITNADRYDVWHVHIGHHLGAIACLLGAMLGKPVILKISGVWEFKYGLLASDSGVVGRLGARWLRMAASVQAISTRIGQELVRRGFAAERIVVVPNAVDTARFHRKAARRDPGAPFVAVFLVRLVAEKGLDTLLTAWAQAFGGKGNVKLRLVGGGPLERALREQSQRLGMGHQVEFLGPIERVEETLSDATVGVLTSEFEGLSNTLLELMAAGLPVIATAVSGSEDFVETGRNGWLVPVGDVDAAAACLREAATLSDAKLRALGEMARRDVESSASLDAVVGKLLGLYRGGAATMKRELRDSPGGRDRPSAAARAGALQSAIDTGKLTN